MDSGAFTNGARPIAATVPGARHPGQAGGRCSRRDSHGMTDVSLTTGPGTWSAGQFWLSQVPGSGQTPTASAASRYGSAVVIANLEALIGAADAGATQVRGPEVPVVVRETSMLRQRALDRLASLKKDGE